MDTFVKGADRAALSPKRNPDGRFVIPAESPFRSAPVMRELIRNTELMLIAPKSKPRHIGVGGYYVKARLRYIANSGRAVDVLPDEVWEQIHNRLSPKDIVQTFSTCKEMHAYAGGYMDEAKKRAEAMSDSIIAISNDFSYTREERIEKITHLLAEESYVKVNLTACQHKTSTLIALKNTESVSVLSIVARRILIKNFNDAHLSAAFENRVRTTIHLDISDNNDWTNDALANVFFGVLIAGSVRHLKLDCNNMRAIERANSFFQMIFDPRFLVRELSLAGSEILGCLSDFGMSLLAYGLARNHPRSVRILNLDRSSRGVGYTRYPDDAEKFIFPDFNPDLDEMEFEEFSKNELQKWGTSGVQIVVESLTENRTLRALSLASCELNDHIAEAMANSLIWNKTLRKLNLGNNLICDKGIKRLGEAIERNSSLELLILASNKKVGKRGWMAFFEALSANTGLQHLNLNSCAIGDKEAKALTLMLQTNRSLKELILSNTPMTSAGMTVLALSLNKHPSVRLLDLAGNFLPLDHLPMLEKLVADGIRVRVNTSVQYKAADANSTSSSTMSASDPYGYALERADFWLRAAS